MATLATSLLSGQSPTPPVTVTEQNPRRTLDLLNQCEESSRRAPKRGMQGCGESGRIRLLVSPNMFCQLQVQGCQQADAIVADASPHLSGYLPGSLQDMRLVEGLIWVRDNISESLFDEWDLVS
jgi:hypothetical protein